MSNNAQLLCMLALLALVSVLAAREVRRVFRGHAPKGYAELAAEQLAYAQRQALLHRVQAEEHEAMADMYDAQAARIKQYCVDQDCAVYTPSKGTTSVRVTVGNGGGAGSFFGKTTVVGAGGGGSSGVPNVG